MGIYRINQRSRIIGGTGFGGRQQSPVLASGPMFSGYDIPPQEVAELYKLYTQTGGPSWINHTNWFENKQCSTWYGLTVAGGRVTEINIGNNNLVGVTSFNPKPLSDLATLYFYSNPALSARFAIADIPLGVTGFLAYSTQSIITGTLSDIPPLAISFQCQSSPSVISGGSLPMPPKGMFRLRLHNMGLTVASVDSIIERIYTDRAIFTNAAPELQIHGNNAAPSGTYQDSATPTTGKEMIYKLVNDPDGEGFKKWAITYTA